MARYPSIQAVSYTHLDVYKRQALFAAWPMVYAAAFSGFYVAMILVLASLFFRPVGFDYRSKICLLYTSWRAL